MSAIGQVLQGFLEILKCVKNARNNLPYSKDDEEEKNNNMDIEIAF